LHAAPVLLRGIHELKVCRQQESQRAGFVMLYGATGEVSSCERLFISSEAESAFTVWLWGSIASIKKYMLTSSVPSIASSL
jgi:hypothetical protein